MRKLATIRRISDIKPIKDADRIELAIVDGWKCVTKKGEFSVGDAIIYCEIDSFLPVREEFEFLRSSSLRTMENREGFRLRTIKLRGQISQGLLVDPSILGRPFEVGEDVTAELGIEKFEPPIPACLGGDVVGGFPAFIAKTDEERIQNLASQYDELKGKSFYVSEKLDGTSFTAFYHDSEFGICGRNWQLAESDANTHWRIAKKLQLEERMRQLGLSVAIQGELIGPGIQSNRYRLDGIELRVFNVFDIEAYCYLDKQRMEEVCGELGLSTVPPLGTETVPDSIDQLLAMAEGKSVLNSKVEREGLVWVCGSGQSRISFKVISNRFLTKHED